MFFRPQEIVINRTKVRKVPEVVPVELIFQRIEKRLQFFGETDDLEHEGNLLSISCCDKALIDEIASFC